MGNRSQEDFFKSFKYLACYNKAHGTKRGRMSKDVMYFSDLLYNSLNFRDIYSNKPKGTTRKEQRQQQEFKPAPELLEHETFRTIRFLREFNNKYRKGYTEVYDEHQDLGTHFHHIFPKSNFPEISFYYENIIALSPTQHLTYAHPNGDTHNIDLDYQFLLLEEKAKRIYENINDDSIETIYSYKRFIEVLNAGFNKDYNTDDSTYESILSIIYENKKK